MKNFAGFRRLLVIWLALERFVEVQGGIFIAAAHTVGGRVWRRMVRKHELGGYQAPPNIIPEGIMTKCDASVGPVSCAGATSSVRPRSFFFGWKAKLTQ